MLNKEITPMSEGIQDNEIQPIFTAKLNNSKDMAILKDALENAHDSHKGFHVQMLENAKLAQLIQGINAAESYTYAGPEVEPTKEDKPEPPKAVQLSMF